MMPEYYWLIRLEICPEYDKVLHVGVSSVLSLSGEMPNIRR